VLERLAAAFGAEAALVIAPGRAQPLGEETAYPRGIADDVVLLAQIRSAWAAHGQQAIASGEPFQADLDSGHRRAGLLVVPAEPPGAARPCAVALIGDVARWKAGARATLRSVAAIIAAAGHPAAGDAAAGDAARDAVTRAAAARDRAVRDGAARAGTVRDGAADPVPALTAVPGPAAAAGAQAGPVGHDALARALVAGSPTAIVAVDSSRRIREFNPAAERLFGCSRADVLGRDMPETLVPKRWRARFVQAMAAYLATGDRREFTGPVKLRALRADGTERPIVLAPMPVTVAGTTYFFGFMHDTSELDDAAMAVAEGDARFALLSDLAPVGIVQTDVDGSCRFVNDKWCEMTQIPASEVIGHNWRGTINPEDVARIDAIRDTSGALTEVSTDCRLRTVAGDESWVQVVVRRVLDQQGELVGRVAALTDVQARKELEQATETDRRRLSDRNVELLGQHVAAEKDRRKLTAQNDELRDLNDSKVRYLATVSHELRTPLTSIVSFTELLRSENPDLGAEAGEYLDIIQRNAERLLRVVSDLLDLGSLEEGVARLELKPISVPGIARESVRTGWASAAADGIRLDVSAQDGPAVQADSSRMQQVLDNLISNAVKFSVTGGRVEVRATHNAREWRIDVADGGMGIPATEVDHLFDRFFRASNARSAEVQGTGLGLPTAKAITELHGGRIEVASTVGTGSTFTVYLPIG
jgi:PAS domain S-box-containing protein